MLRRHNRLLVATYVIADFAAAAAAFVLAYLIRFDSGLMPVTDGQPPLGRYVALAPAIAALVPLAFRLQGLYRLRRGLLSWPAARRMIDEAERERGR